MDNLQQLGLVKEGALGLVCAPFRYTFASWVTFKIGKLAYERHPTFLQLGTSDKFHLETPMKFGWDLANPWTTSFCLNPFQTINHKWEVITIRKCDCCC